MNLRKKLIKNTCNNSKNNSQKQEEFNIEQEESNIEQSKAKIEEYKARIEEAKAKIEEAKIEEAKAKIEEAKIEQSKAKIEQFKDKIEQYKAKIEEAKIEEAKIEQSKAKIEQYKIKIEKAKNEQYKIEDAKAKIEQYKAKIEEAKIKEAKIKEAKMEDPTIEEAKIEEYKNKIQKIYSIIPLNIFQTWYTLDLPPKMKDNCELLKKQNPEFNYFLYDDTMCRNFIKENFDEEILYAFDKLKPGAYKADLWRCCVLYKYGGIYLDIKFSCIKNFKLIKLTNKEYFVRDLPHNDACGVYNALLICLPNNNKLYKCIQLIVENVKNNIYGESYLHVTGPQLLLKIFSSFEIDNFDIYLNKDLNIHFKNIPIIKPYNEYRDEQKIFKNIEHYGILFKNKNIYNHPTLLSKLKINLSRKIYKNIINDNTLFTSGTPTIVELTDGEYLINLRWVNYTFNKDFNITMINDNVFYKNYKTLNSRFKVNKNFEKISEEIFLEDNFKSQIDYLFMGIEDIKIFKFNNDYYYLATIFDNNRKLRSISSNKYIIDDNNYILDKNIILPIMYDTNRIKIWEKNWALFNYNGKLSIIYNWYPLQIGQIDYNTNTMNIIEIKYNIPNYFNGARGNSCGYIKNNEIWFVLHKTFDKNYLHFFAIFDLNMNLLKYSELFKLGNSLIEFCIGLIIKETDIILSYSLFDTQSIISIYDINYINYEIKWYNNDLL